jgi:hypothetical protein
MTSLATLPMPARNNISMAETPANTNNRSVETSGKYGRRNLPNLEFFIRSGSAAKAKKGNTEVTPTS